MIIELTPQKHFFLYPDMKKGIMNILIASNQKHFTRGLTKKCCQLPPFTANRRLEYRWSQMAPNICDENVSEAYMDIWAPDRLLASG